MMAQVQLVADRLDTIVVLNILPFPPTEK